MLIIKEMECEVERGMWKLAVFSEQFFYKPETPLKPSLLKLEKNAYFTKSERGECNEVGLPKSLMALRQNLLTSSFGLLFNAFVFTFIHF